jgi:FMN phosphatase YigB (HAD superfamily)
LPKWDCSDLLDGDAIITNLAAKATKPNSEIYEYAAKQLALSLGQCLCVGDDPAEVNGALASGMVGLLKLVPIRARMALVKGGLI